MNGYGFLHGLEKLELPEHCLRDRSQSNGQGWMPALVIEALVRRLLLGDRFFYQPEAVKSYYTSFNHSATKLFDPSHGLGFFLVEPPPEVRNAYDELFRLLKAYKTFCETQGITFVVALFPQRFQVQPGDWKKTVETYGLKESAFNRNRPNDLIRDFCIRNSIHYIDPTRQMLMSHTQLEKNLYLPHGDMHWNKLGHIAWFNGASKDFEKIVQTVRKRNDIP